MGLASKLAASSGGPGGYPPAGGAPGGYPPQQGQQQQPGGYPGQTQYQAYNPAKPGGQPSGQPGYPPPYPGQLVPGQSQPAYPPSSPQPGYGAQRPLTGPPSQGYATPPVSPQPPQAQQAPYQQSYQQPSYGAPPQQYARPPPPPPQSQPPLQQYGGYQQPSQYNQQYNQPYQQPYSQPYQVHAHQLHLWTSGYAPGLLSLLREKIAQGQPGQYPPQQQQQQGYPPGGQQYGGPPQQAGPQQVAAYKQVLQAVINEKNLQSMYPPGSPMLDQIANSVGNKVDQLCQKWRVPREVGQDIVKLALFDIVLYIDDSGSMQFEENGERIQDLKLILSRVAYAASLFDDDGIQVRFMNSDEGEQNRAVLRTEQDVEQIVARVPFKGLTPMGTSLRNKVLEPLVVAPARSNQLRKPVLVITITDGQPAGEPQGAVFDAIKYAAAELSRMPRYGQGAISFQFAQVGNDLKAREFLGKLDSEPGIGNLVDSTSNFEVEQDEMSRANPPVDLTPELWLVKLLLGAIDSSYDTKDEQGSRPAGGQQYGAPPPGQYGAPPQGQYGAPPPGQYGAPQPGQYGAPGGAPGGAYGRPPQGQSPYPQQQQQQPGYGQPAQGYPPQQGGHPPQQGGYPPQQGQHGGGYGAPPPPPRY
ncbi:MAG: hypothetical protein M1812_005465 [Candelaria pacifica]|nr:MAG: hypothetical protein M1812_005465 [Candelaria pacifica]